jgi:hypothetical protein
MARKCPPGVICIENVTITFLILVFLVIALYFYYFGFSPNTIVLNQDIVSTPSVFPRWNASGDASRDVLMNPYSPPLKMDRFMPPISPIDPRGMPINVRTRGFDDAYRQVGLLTRINGRETLLALMGRPLHTNRNKWQYYTISDQNHGIKLPVSKNGRSCTGEYGCDDLMNGDTIYVEGYKDAFKVTMYDNAAPRYIPHL